MSPCGVHPHVRHPEPRVLWDARHERWSERRQAVSVDVVRLQQPAVHERVRGAERVHRREVVGKNAGEDHTVVPIHARHAVRSGDHAVRRTLPACLRMNHAVTCSRLRPVAVAAACRTRSQARRFSTQPQNLALDFRHAPGLLFVSTAPLFRARFDALVFEGVARARTAAGPNRPGLSTFVAGYRTTG